MNNDNSIDQPIAREKKCAACGTCCSILTKRHKAFITTRCITITLFIIGLLFLAAGIVFVVITNNMFEEDVEYNDECLDQIANNNHTSNNCTVYFNITKTLKGEVILLYHLDNFYQNHRRIFMSKSDKQIKGSYLTYKQLSSCAPKISVNDSSSPSALYLPCGLAPLSFFNDTYHFTDLELSAKFTEEGISLVQERKKIYKPISPQYKEGIRWLEDITPKGTTDEHFIVWMRTAAMPNFIKVFSICHDCVINEGVYEVQVQLNYPQSMYDGGRSLIITTTSALGSRSYFISVTYISIGGLSIFLGLICLFQLLCCPRKLGQIQAIFQENRSITVDQRLTATNLPIRHSSRRQVSTSNSLENLNERSENELEVSRNSADGTAQNQQFINIENSSDSDNASNAASKIISENASNLIGDTTNNNNAAGNASKIIDTNTASLIGDTTNNGGNEN